MTLKYLVNFIDKLLLLCCRKFRLLFFNICFFGPETDAAFLLPAAVFLDAAAGTFFDLETLTFPTFEDFFLLDVFFPLAELLAVVFLVFDVFFFEAFFTALAFLALAGGFF